MLVSLFENSVNRIGFWNLSEHAVVIVMQMNNFDDLSLVNVNDDDVNWSISSDESDSIGYDDWYDQT